jgi:hypothetical protein
MVVPTKLKIKLQYDPEIPLLGMPKELKLGSHRDISTCMFIEVLVK